MTYTVTVTCTVEVSADSENDAVNKAADMFDPIVEKLVRETALGTGTSDISRLVIGVPFRELASFHAA